MGPDARAVDRGFVVVNALLVLALAVATGLTLDATARKLQAATGGGEPGSLVVELERHGYRTGRIPVGTFSNADGTRTSGVAWQARPAAVGDRFDGVRVGDRAWPPDVRVGAGDVLLVLALLGAFVWRAVALMRSVEQRGDRTGDPPPDDPFAPPAP